MSRATSGQLTSMSPCRQADSMPPRLTHLKYSRRMTSERNVGRYSSLRPLASKMWHDEAQVWHLAQCSMLSKSGCRNVQLFSRVNSLSSPERKARTRASSSSRVAGLGTLTAQVSSRMHS